MEGKHAVVVVLLILSSSWGFARNPSNMSNPVSQCGINALYAGIRYLGFEEHLDHLYLEIQPDKNNMVSLYQLARYANKKGLYTTSAKHPTLEELRTVLTEHSAVLLHYEYDTFNGFRQSHIIALVRPETGQIWVLDFPFRPYIAEDNKIADALKQSKGLLILSRLPFQHPIFGRLNTFSNIWILLAAVSLGNRSILPK